MHRALTAIKKEQAMRISSFVGATPRSICGAVHQHQGVVCGRCRGSRRNPLTLKAMR